MRLSLSMEAPFFDGSQECWGVDTDVFYATEEGRTKQLVEFAKSICAGCKFRAECLEWALENSEHGVWGGTTANERDEIKKAQRRSMS